MARADDTELIDTFEEFYRSYYRNEIAELAQKYPNEQKSLYIDWGDLYRFDSDLADDFRNKPKQLREYAEEALRLYDLPVDVSLGQAHVRLRNLPETTEIREIRSDHRGMLIAIQGIVRKATDVRPKITTAAFECQRCGTLSRIPQEGGDFQEPHECQGCERQGPFRINYDQSEFIDAQKLRVQESPEGLRGGETPQSIDVNIEDDITGEVTPGDHVTTTGILNLEQQGNDREKSPMFDVYMEGLSVEIEDEQFEEMDISEEDKKEIIELSNTPDIYEEMVGAIAPSIYGYEMEKQAMIFQLFSGVTKFLPDDSRTRGDLHILLVGDPGTGKCLKGDTMVTVGDGRRKRIGDLVEEHLDDPIPVDDGVYDTVDIPVPSLTDSGEIEQRRARKVWKRDAPDLMYQITTAAGREIEVTPSHPLFVQSDGAFVPREAAHLGVDTTIAVASEGNPATDGGLTAVGNTIASAETLPGRGVVTDRIASIEPVEPDYDWVYDLEVADTHSYISNEIVSHNSQLLQYIKNIAPRSVYTSGKGSSAAGLCVTGDTRIQTPDGERKIQTLVESELPEPVSTETAVESNIPVYTFDPEQDCFEIRETSHFWRMPEKDCRRIRTAGGRAVEATLETPVLVRGADGAHWRKISTVETGDTVAVRERGTEHVEASSTETAPAADGGSLVWETVTEAVDTGEKEVFDLTVPDTHNFVGNGIVTHNTAAAVRDDFGEGQQWTLEAGALVLADQGIAAVDELDKMRCVTGETLVHTPDGIIPIRELANRAKQSGEIETLPNGQTIREIDADVWTMTDEGTIESRRVTAVHEYDSPETVQKVTLESGESVNATPDHPFFVLSDGERTTKRAEELRGGDWVYVPRSIPGTTTDGGTSVSKPSDSGRLRSITPAHGAILGYIAGDGNIYYSRKDGRYGIRFTNAEGELLAHFEDVCREAFPQSTPARYPSEKRDDGVETVRLHGKQYADALLDCGLNPETYEGKRVPEQVTAADRDTKTSFLRALADSEGTVTTRNVKIHSASYELLLGTKMLLSEFGITSQIQTRERDSLDLYVLAITSKKSLQAFAHHIGFTLTRKQEALDRACERTTGTRTILDVLPECSDHFAAARESLRLHQSECGLVDSTYCNFENGDANFSLRTARTVLERFESRKETAQSDCDTLSTPQPWDVLDSIKQRYHVSQKELAGGTRYSQQQISRLWGSDEELKSVVQNRLRKLVRNSAATPLDRLHALIHSDVKWRRIDSVETVADTESTRPDIELAKNRLARLLACPIPEAASEAEILLTDEPEASDWDELEAELRRHELSYQDLADRFDVDGSTISRWFSKTVDGPDFETVRSVAFDLIRAKRTRIRDIRTEIAERTEPKVYDLTVDGTHNFVANGAIIHNSEDQSAMHQALEQQSYHPDSEILLSDGRRVRIGEFVDGMFEANADRAVDGVDCEILPVEDVGVHTVDLETKDVTKTDVDRVSRHEAPEAFVRVRFSNGREVLVTPEHPMFVEQEGAVGTVEANAIEEGAFVPAPRKLPNSARPVELDEAQIGKEKDVTLPAELSPTLGEILGLLAAEGHSYAGSSHEIGFSNQDDQLLDRFGRLMWDVFGVESSDTTNDAGTVTKQYNSTKLYRWFESNFPELMHSACGKRIPAAVLGASEEVIRRFLVGAFAGDGSVESEAMSFSTASERLARDYADALSKIGVASRIHYTRQEDAWKTYVMGDSTERFVNLVVEKTDPRYENARAFVEQSNETARHHDVLPPSAARELRELRRLLGLRLTGMFRPNLDNDHGVRIETVQSELDELRERIETVQRALRSADTLSAIRSAVGWSGRQLADSLDGITTSTVHYAEDGGYDEPRRQSLTERARTAVKQALSAAEKRIDALEDRTELRYYRVTDVETVPNEGEYECEWVYDVTVEPTNTFVSQGVVLHNSISVSKAGINATLKSRCSLLGAANPTYGRFDEYEPIGEQIDLAPPLISRFDLIFTVTDKPDAEKDAELAEHILQTNYAGELNTHRTETSASNYTKEEVERITDDVAPTIEPDLLRKYVAYAQRNCYPTMTEDAKSAIQQYYVDLRTTGDDEDAPVPVTARKLEALVRLSEASARVRLSDTVEESDAQRAIDIAQYCLEDIGLDPETGELDADMIETGTSKSQRDRIKNIKQLISTIEAEYDEGAPVEIIIERAEEEGMDQSKAEHEIEKLKQKGEVYEPQQNHLRTT